MDLACSKADKIFFLTGKYLLRDILKIKTKTKNLHANNSTSLTQLFFGSQEKGFSNIVSVNHWQATVILNISQFFIM